ncbi:MAG: hypothetical protein J1E40_02185 [Oscillospiraceae bacterium]|nr:hypothetical protein [Oscillospiraceae bacterium]
MNSKRLIGTEKIFLYSCGEIIGIAAIVWLIINSMFSLYFAINNAGYLGNYTVATADVITPWLLMVTSMFIYYRYWKICNANNVSGIKQALVFPFMSVFISIAFAAGDMLFTKLIMQTFYGGIVCTRFEYESSYFLGIIHKYIISLESEPEIYSPYTIQNLLLIFAIMTIYYYCCFIAGCYIMQCFRYVRKMSFLYYALTFTLLILLIYALSKVGEMFGYITDMYYYLKRVLLLALFTDMSLNPITFLFIAPYIAKGEISDLYIYFIILLIFIFIVILFIALLSKCQFPMKRHIKKALENYEAEYNIKNGDNENE